MQATAALTNETMWVWVLGILATILTGGLFAWLTAVHGKLSSIERQNAGDLMKSGQLDLRVTTIESQMPTLARADMADRVERETGRRLSGIEDGIGRLNARMDSINNALLGQLAAALDRQARATELLAEAFREQQARAGH